MADRPRMQDPIKVQQLMPLMREFGGLERQRLGPGVSPLEFQRWLDLKGQIGKNFAEARADGLSATGGASSRSRPTRLLVSYRSRKALIDSIVPNIKPAGFFVPTPFAASVGTELILRVTLEKEGESADVPVVVVASITQGAHTLSTNAMGMSVKILKPTRGQAPGISKIFGPAFADAFSLAG